MEADTAKEEEEEEAEAEAEAEEAEPSCYMHGELETPSNCLLSTHHSPLTTHHSLLTAHYLLTYLLTYLLGELEIPFEIEDVWLSMREIDDPTNWVLASYHQVGSRQWVVGSG